MGSDREKGAYLALSLIPGSSKVYKEIGEEIAEQIIKEAGEELVEKAAKEAGEKFLKMLGSI